jgi:hypothetical protein
MPDIIKTIESWRRPRRVHRFLAHTQRWEDPRDATAYGSLVQDAAGFYVFQLGRGEPQRKPVRRLWFVFRGRLYGSFEIVRIERNAGQFEDLVTMYKREDLAKEWHLRDDNWVVICKPPFAFFKGRHIYYEDFQGWRYFDLESYRKLPEARWKV